LKTGRAAARATGAERPATHDGAPSRGVTMRSSASTTYGSKPVPDSSCSSESARSGVHAGRYTRSDTSAS
jgi:hypothetical protein